MTVHVEAASAPAAPAPRRVSRRTVGRAAVWSVPVIASVTLAPAAAASAGSAFTVTITNAVVCRTPTDGVVRYTVVTTGTLPAGSTFLLSKFTLTGSNSSFNSVEIDVPATFTKTPPTGTNQPRITITSVASMVDSTFVVDVRDVAFSTTQPTTFRLAYTGTKATTTTSLPSSSAPYTEGDLTVLCSPS